MAPPNKSLCLRLSAVQLCLTLTLSPSLYFWCHLSLAYAPSYSNLWQNKKIKSLGSAHLPHPPPQLQPLPDSTWVFHAIWFTNAQREEQENNNNKNKNYVKCRIIQRRQRERERIRERGRNRGAPQWKGYQQKDERWAKWREPIGGIKQWLNVHHHDDVDNDDYDDAVDVASIRSVENWNF